MYKDGKKHGYGELYLAEGGYMKCNWIQGRQHGHGIIKVENEEFEEPAQWNYGEYVTNN